MRYGGGRNVKHEVYATRAKRIISFGPTEWFEPTRRRVFDVSSDTRPLSRENRQTKGIEQRSKAGPYAFRETRFCRCDWCGVAPSSAMILHEADMKRTACYRSIVGQLPNGVTQRHLSIPDFKIGQSGGHVQEKRHFSQLIYPVSFPVQLGACIIPEPAVLEIGCFASQRAASLPLKPPYWRNSLKPFRDLPNPLGFIGKTTTATSRRKTS
eukprot:scaffold69_cov248-Pinguiococcus_pyrenoidosus.AAC.67